MARSDFSQGRKTPFTQGDVARAQAGGPSPNMLQRAIRGVLRYALDARNETAWMGPGQVIQPVAQEEEGRIWDYPTGVNTYNTPRMNEGVPFGLLRQLADSYDLMRLVIERRKDQIERLKYRFVTTNKTDADEEDARVKELQEFFAYPDRVNPWGTWLRMATEEILVTDALTFYPRKTNGGTMYSLDIMDGCTIKPVIDAQGRRPIAPQPAFQQYLKGVAAVSYTADELLYMPRNLRAHKVYGYPPVEQVIATVNIALRRQSHQLNYYTEGNVPEAFIPTPDTWSPKQVRDFQRGWDSMMEGAQKQKRKAKFIPGLIKNVIWTREPTLKDQMDEWLGRIVCFAFSYPPSALTAQVNRATAETAQETATDEGLAPLMQHILQAMNTVIRKYFGYDDIRFEWDTDKVTDPKVLSDIHEARLENGSLTLDEARIEAGRQPYNIAGQSDVPKFMRQLSPQQQAEQDAAAQEDAEGLDSRNPDGSKKPKGAQAAGESNPAKGPGKKAGGKADEGDDAEKLAKRAITAELLKRQRRPAVRKQEKALGKALLAAFTVMADKVADAYEAQFEKMEKVTLSQDDLNAWIENLEIELDSAARVMKQAIDEVARDGGRYALGTVKVTDAAALASMNTRAGEYAASRAVELITKGAKGGKLSESTRQMLRAMLAEAAEQGMTNEQVAKTLRESYAFSEKRAMMIAKTELRDADVQGNLAGWKASGVPMRKEWLLSNEEHICEECEENAEQGPIPLDDVFTSGDAGPPAHPNCRCDVAPVVD